MGARDTLSKGEAVMLVSSAESEASRQALPELSCDLVMKGGITSGIVYPLAALKLQEKYTFRKIGGTSAGAIAAAGIAAAEFNRDKGGFKYLEDNVTAWLGKNNNLSNLFQAIPQTKPLLDLLHVLLPSPPPGTSTAQNNAQSTNKTQASKPPSVFQNILKGITLVFRVLASWFTRYPPLSPGVVLVILLGIILSVLPPLAIFAVVYLLAPRSAAQGIWILELCLVILGLFGAWLAWHVGGIISSIAYLPKNFYGICSGHSDSADLKSPHLTDWLYTILQEMAGEDLPRPLTFEQLSANKIELKMVTSNLSHNLPYLMPEGLHNFLFKKSEMRKLFPEAVVQHMIDNQPDPHDQDPERRPLIPREKLPELLGDDGYYYLPNAEKLPVIVCTRMSLSFPMLLSAVPLYTIDTLAYKAYISSMSQGQVPPRLAAEAMQLNWFSDGGICSNFPIQFFDAWLPSCPTFGISLASLSQATSSLQECAEELSSATTRATLQEDDAIDAIYLPKPEDAQNPEWSQVNGLLNFARAIFGTAQNYRDTMQANLPSYRERIVQVRLDNSEGGLNLTMPKPVIDRVMVKGQEAGAKFCDPSEFNFDHHVWVRFLVLMAQLEKNIVSMKTVLNSPDFEHQLQQQLSVATDPQQRYPYWEGKDQQWCDETIKRVEALRTLINSWNIEPIENEQPSFFHKDAPVPQPVLRVTPAV
jgi:predicted acylesterase/phospholipase RssA